MQRLTAYGETQRTQLLTEVPVGHVEGDRTGIGLEIRRPCPLGDRGVGGEELR